MSDFKSAQPVRTEGDLSQKLQTRVIDGTIDANKLTVNADGSVNITDNGGSLTVDATDLDIRDLSHTQDSVKVGDGTDFLAINTDGSVNTNIRDGSGNALTSSAAGATRPLDVQLRDSSGATYSNSNPLPVSVSVDSVGTEVNDYNTFVDLAVDGTNNHDYVTVSNFRLTQIVGAMSGRGKFEVQVETAAGSGTFNTLFVQFCTSADPNVNLKLASPPLVPSGAKVRVIRTNRDQQVFDVFSTICGQSL